MDRIRKYNTVHVWTTGVGIHSKEEEDYNQFIGELEGVMQNFIDKGYDIPDWRLRQFVAITPEELETLLTSEERKALKV